jgi:DNA-binding SARP family transcriptional activator
VVSRDVDNYTPGRLYNQDSPEQIHETIKLLELVEKDYQGTRKQLENLGRTLAEREILVSRGIRNAKIFSGNNSCLCLLDYQSKTMGNQLGTAILGIIKQDSVLPILMRLEIHCLDGFQVSYDGISIEHWESIKAKSLLQYLITRPRKPVAKEMLMEALWPGCEPRVSGNNLKAAMHGLRQTFVNLLDGDQNFPYIVFTQGTYQINPEILLWLDVEQFEIHWENGRRLQAAGDEDKAMREFKLAEELYKSDYLADDPYEEWTILRREALQDIYLNILGKLADNYLRKNDFENCLVYCLKILDKDPCREDAYQRIMRCYYRSGLRSRCLRWYEICRKAIESGLDTAPDPETTRLYQKVLNNEPI